MAGDWSTSSGVLCNNPTFVGNDILFFANSPDGNDIALVTIKPDVVDVSVRNGSGATFTNRVFEGSGVSALDPATGATFDSDVSEVTPAGTNKGTLGNLTHVSGTVSCGTQTAGTSTVTAVGSTPDGAVNGPFEAYRVACTDGAQFGKGVSINARVTAGTKPNLFILSMAATGNATLFSNGADASSNASYAIDPSGSYTVSDTGAHIDADFVQAQGNGATPDPLRMHLAGDVTCGAFNKTS